MSVMEEQAQLAAACIDAALAIIAEKEAELARLDAVAGDGDHGAGMLRGFRAAAGADRSGTPGQIIANAGVAFSDAAGGASGALVGMFLITIGNNLQGEIDGAAVHHALMKGVEAIAQLGKAKVGDKTMLDTLDPFVKAFGEAVTQGEGTRAAWQKALAAAEAGKNATRDMASQRGRSAVLKEKSVGHLDPGATSMYYILVAVGETM